MHAHHDQRPLGSTHVCKLGRRAQAIRILQAVLAAREAGAACRVRFGVAKDDDDLPRAWTPAHPGVAVAVVKREVVRRGSWRARAIRLDLVDRGPHLRGIRGERLQELVLGQRCLRIAKGDDGEANVLQELLGLFRHRLGLALRPRDRVGHASSSVDRDLHVDGRSRGVRCGSGVRPAAADERDGRKRNDADAAAHGFYSRESATHELTPSSPSELTN
jgi:hypothetical protein